MKINKYAISEDSLYQLDGTEWVLIHDETMAFECFQDSLKFRMTQAFIDDNPFTLFNAEEDCIHMIENDRPYLLRSVIEEFALNHLSN